MDGPIYNDTKKDIPNLYQIQSKVINKKYYANQKEIKIVDYLNDTIKNLKTINLINTRFEIEFIRYKQAEKPGFLWQEEIVQKLHFFSSVIGLIDGLIDDLERHVDLFSYFDHETEIKEYRIQQSQLLSIREIVLKDYNEKCTISDPTILNETLSTIPAYKSFSGLYSNAAEKHYQLDLQLELVNAYNIGYTSCGRCDYDAVLELYTKLNHELKEYEYLNNQEIKKEKKKILNKNKY